MSFNVEMGWPGNYDFILKEKIIDCSNLNLTDKLVKYTRKCQSVCDSGTSFLQEEYQISEGSQIH